MIKMVGMLAAWDALALAASALIDGSLPAAGFDVMKEDLVQLTNTNALVGHDPNWSSVHCYERD
jgi:hypothetical protein